ncbi:DUF11 domain-containing protein [Streptomyces indicus]|uniref:Conserved repeat domain-containing protein n=1 Tax=Streptomyces indicus TaxID=417292 RepID=A0A1G9HWU1_9ACTN|nr:DUF11 domain-containing protein [Streptomyces indicus]SDL17438.1 conserved repeat domain-containing protein [Streptomyces indicus]
MGRARRRTLGALVATATAATSLIGLAPAAAVVVEPFAKRYDEALYGDFIELGNAVLDCPSAPPDEAANCRDAQSGANNMNNNQFTMEYTDTAGLSATVINSSTGKVEIPPGAEVAYARMYWGGNTGTYRRFGTQLIDYCDTAGPATKPAGDPLTKQPVLKVGSGAETRVTVQNAVATPSTTGGPHYYTAEADVTRQFAGVPTGSEVPVAVGDVWAPTGKGCVGGWSLYVVYKYDAPEPTHAPDRKHVYLYGGHVVQRSSDPDTTIKVDGFYRSGDGPLRAGVTAFEGDRNVLRDTFLVNGTNIPNEEGVTNNFFDSHAMGCDQPCDDNNFSIDAKTVEIPAATIPQGATTANLTFRTRNDTYVPSALAFSVPVPDVEITKTASPKNIQPGDKLTYTVTAKNISRLPYPGAKFTDDLTDNLDDATYNNDAKAEPSGNVSYDEPKISFVGDIPAGETVTVTYSVTVNDPRTGDGKMRNNIDVESPRSNCEAGSTDPACGTTPVIEEEPAPVVPIGIVTKPVTPVVPPCTDTTNTITLTNATTTARKGAKIHWPVVKGGTPKASSGTVTRSGKNWVWTGDVPAKGKVVIKQTVTSSCTPGGVVVIPVTGDVPKTTCTPAKTRAGGTDPCVSVIVSKRTQARPAPPDSASSPELAETGGTSNTMLFGGLAIVMCGLGALALAASRSRRD